MTFVRQRIVLFTLNINSKEPVSDRRFGGTKKDDGINNNNIDIL